MKKAPRILFTLFLIYITVLSTLRTVPAYEARATRAPQPPVQIATTFFASLARAIDTVSGRVVIDLRSGTFVGSEGVQWQFPPSTTMVVVFNYRNGALDVQPEPASISFSNEVLLFPAGNLPNFHFVVSRISYDRSGRPAHFFRKGPNGEEIEFTSGIGDTIWPALARHLEFASAPADIFFGRPIAGFPYPLPVPGLPPPPVPPPASQKWVQRVRFAASSEQPALLITLKDQATIWFIQPPIGSSLPPNFVTVKAPSSCLFQSIAYDFDSNRLTGTLASLIFTTQDAQLATDGLDLRLRQDTRLQFQTLDFDSQGGPGGIPQISGNNGFISGGLGLGSKLTLNDDAVNPGRQTNLVAAAGSQLTLRSLAANFTSSGAAFTLGAGSSLNLAIADGRVPLGPNYVLIRDGTITMDLTASGAWGNGTHPVVKANIGLLTCDIYAGRFGVRMGYETRLKGGTIRATDLAFDSSATPTLTGQFSSIAFDLEDGARFDVPDRFNALCDRGARLYADDPKDPLKISAGSNILTGRVDAVVHFRKITIVKGPELRHGSFQASLLLLSNGKIEGTDVFLDGEAHLQSDITPDDIIVDVEVEEGKLFYAGEVPIIEAAVRARTRPFGGINIQAPDCPIMGIANQGPARARYTLYPVRVNIALEKEIKFPFMWIRVEGGREGETPRWSFLPKPGELTPPKSVDVMSALTLNIPARQPDQYGDEDRQQLVRTTCLVAGNSSDITLRPHIYGGVPLQVKLYLDSGHPVLHFIPSVDIQFDLDLCDLDQLIAVIAFVVTVQIIKRLVPILGDAVDAATGGPIVQGIAGEVAMQLFVKKAISSMIAKRMSEQISNGIKFRPLG